eukprot:1161539-Pelagomonas_calceolata.AAC.1
MRDSILNARGRTASVNLSFLRVQALGTIAKSMQKVRPKQKEITKAKLTSEETLLHAHRLFHVQALGTIAKSMHKDGPKKRKRNTAKLTSEKVLLRVPWPCHVVKVKVELLLHKAPIALQRDVLKETTPFAVEIELLPHQTPRALAAQHFKKELFSFAYKCCIRLLHQVLGILPSSAAQSYDTFPRAVPVLHRLMLPALEISPCSAAPGYAGLLPRAQTPLLVLVAVAVSRHHSAAVAQSPVSIIQQPPSFSHHLHSAFKIIQPSR